MAIGKGVPEHSTEALLAQVSVLYEDTDVVVINKPSGLIVHEDGRKKEATVVTWLLAHAPEARGVGEPSKTPHGTLLERSGVVHRLDAETSGVLILAKTQGAFNHLKAQFHERAVQKEYRAFVYGTMKEQWGTIRRAIGRSARDFRLRSAERGARGMMRPAVTHWQVLTQSSTHTYLSVKPETGRTHQIRVHLKAIGKPIVKDTLYAGGLCETGGSLCFARLALHAHTLTLVTPDGVRRSFEASLPEDFLEAERLVAKPQSSC